MTLKRRGSPRKTPRSSVSITLALPCICRCARTMRVTATSEDGEIMGVRHAELPIEGVQFHPESILSEHGHAMLRNFLETP